MEYAYDDWCISVLADSLGDTETKEKYARFADAYEFYFDPATRFMRGLIVKVNGVLRSIPVLPITVMMIIARVLHGNGLGLFRMISRDW